MDCLVFKASLGYMVKFQAILDYRVKISKKKSLLLVDLFILQILIRPLAWSVGSTSH